MAAVPRPSQGRRDTGRRRTDTRRASGSGNKLLSRTNGQTFRRFFRIYLCRNALAAGRLGREGVAEVCRQFVSNESSESIPPGPYR